MSEVRRALRDGTLTRPERCTASHRKAKPWDPIVPVWDGHYSRPADVRWLHRSCEQRRPLDAYVTRDDA